jgi:hypothetical protein
MPLEWLAAEKSASRLVRQRYKMKASIGFTAYSGDDCDRSFRVFAVHIIYLLNGTAVRRSQKGGRILVELSIVPIGGSREPSSPRN